MGLSQQLRGLGRVRRVPLAAACVQGAISADGRYLAFESQASNLVENDTNGVQDAFRTPRP